VKNLILSEVNVKNIEYIEDTANILLKRVKPNFKKTGPNMANSWRSRRILSKCQWNDQWFLRKVKLTFLLIPRMSGSLSMILRSYQMISQTPGGRYGTLTVALDTTILRSQGEGMPVSWSTGSRTCERTKNFEVTDKISIRIGRERWD